MEWKRESTARYAEILKSGLGCDYIKMFREAEGTLKYPYLVPGSRQYAACLWDWDSWLTDMAIRQIMRNLPEEKRDAARTQALPYERGCILNYLDHCDESGWIPFIIEGVPSGMKILDKPENIYQENMHKPCLAQHAALLVREDGGDAGWLLPQFEKLTRFLDNYYSHHRDAETGLYYWQTDLAIGVDNDPCTFFRPAGSSASIYLNCMMFRELQDAAYLAGRLGEEGIGRIFLERAEELKTAVQKYCWDERDGFFYSVDLNLRPVNPGAELHCGMPRHWPCLIQRIDVWSGFLAMWSGIATDDQAERVCSRYWEEDTFCAPYGIRTLSRLEKMYCVKASNNPSDWLGPVWGVSNYLTFAGMARYGKVREALDMAEKTVQLFGRDLEKTGVLHEYYEPETGEPVINPGFQNWNYLVLNMIEWKEGFDHVQK